MTFEPNSERTRQIALQGQLALKARRGDTSAAQRLQSVFLVELRDGAWHSGKSLREALQTNERVVRQLADFSKGRVISSDRGYRLIECASNAEIDHAEARLLSQARKMQERAVEIRLARNRRMR